jgi:hypothetical protein
VRERDSFCVCETETLTLSGLLDIYSLLKNAVKNVPLWDSNPAMTCVQTISYNTERTNERDIASKLSEKSLTDL